MPRAMGTSHELASRCPSRCPTKACRPDTVIGATAPNTPPCFHDPSGVVAGAAVGVGAFELGADVVVVGVASEVAWTPEAASVFQTRMTR